MKEILINCTTSMDFCSYLPEIYRISNVNDFEKLTKLLQSNSGIRVVDQLQGQLRELIKSIHPARKIRSEEYPALIEEHLNHRSIDSYGVWVYYPWSQCLIHMLDEEEFIEVRTNRNRYKITRPEQAKLREKIVGIIGLSVGQSIAMTLALERSCGELRLADFDTAELSNLNRIRTGVHNLGLKKTIIAAREIAEIDPFIKVKVYSDGITESNIDVFFEDADGKLDVLVEVCDGLDIKVISRYKARDLKVPVVMDTNDRGMLDIERFDLEPDREILHGLAVGLDPNNIRGLTNEQKIPYMLKMIAGDQLSSRLKASMIEVEQSINTWPQLGSSVTLGGAITTDITRRILLDQLHVSGRFYVDLDQIICDPQDASESHNTPYTESKNPYTALQKEKLISISENFTRRTENVERLTLSNDDIQQLMEAAQQAPSAGNNQPWQWVVLKDQFFLFHDRFRSYSWGDFDQIGAHGSLGAALECLHIKALSLGIESQVQLFPEQDHPYFVAAVSFKKIDLNSENKQLVDLAPYLEKRVTNRKLGVREELPESFFQQLRSIVETIPGATIQYVDDDRLLELGEIISACDRERLLFREGHEEFFHEIRWTAEEARRTGDGIDLDLVDISNSEKAGFQVATDWEAISLLEQWDQGRAFQKMSRKGVAAASAMVLFTIPDYTPQNFIQVGRAVLRAWLFATRENIAVHPMLSPVFFFNRLKYGSDQEMSPRMKSTLIQLRQDYEKCFDLENQHAEVFLMKIAKAPEPNGATFRLPINQIFNL